MQFSLPLYLPGPCRPVSPGCCWGVRELKRQLKSALFQRVALSRDKSEVIRLAQEGQIIERPEVFSVMEEVWATDDERIDLVIFLNGLAIILFELKCNAAGQSYQDAIYQYRTSRDPKTRLFRFKAGCIVNFAMDLNEVYMTTKLDENATTFLPFNMGNGEGVDAGAGNPLFPDRYSVSYMWEDILTKDIQSG